MFFEAGILEWGADGRSRITNLVTSNNFILNTNRMFEITDSWQGHSDLFFFDNPCNSRDGGSRMRVWGDKANIILASDTDHGSNEIDLHYYPDDDITATPLVENVRKADIAYCYPYNFSIVNPYSWVVYSQGGWDMKRVLVASAIGELYHILEGDSDWVI